jgi:hypothetical protein
VILAKKCFQRDASDQMKEKLRAVLLNEVWQQPVNKSSERSAIAVNPTPESSQNDLNNEILFSLIQSLICRDPQIHGSEPSPKKS